jgi:GH35 family endo-1,4-beta-xylanase
MLPYRLRLEMANKQELQRQISDLDNRINQTTDQNEKQNLQQQRDQLQRELQKA